MIVVSSKIASVLRATVSLILLFCQKSAIHAAIGNPTVVISVVIACISMIITPLLKNGKSAFAVTAARRAFWALSVPLISHYIIASNLITSNIKKPIPHRDRFKVYKAARVHIKHCLCILSFI